MATQPALIDIEKLDQDDLRHAMSNGQGEVAEQNELKREFKPRICKQSQRTSNYIDPTLVKLGYHTHIRSGDLRVFSSLGSIR